jgi:hypothetical protein
VANKLDREAPAIAETGEQAAGALPRLGVAALDLQAGS